MSEVVKKKKIVFFDMYDNKRDFEYWQQKTHTERLSALEQLRNLYFTNNGIRQRLQRVLTFIEPTQG
jgi:hypothetical protein